eukprot:455425-Amphidinium_carterae.1
MFGATALDASLQVRPEHVIMRWRTHAANNDEQQRCVVSIVPARIVKVQVKVWEIRSKSGALYPLYFKKAK